MKPALLSILLIVCCLYRVSAQTTDAEADALSNLLGVQKRELIAKLV